MPVPDVSPAESGFHLPVFFKFAFEITYHLSLAGSKPKPNVLLFCISARISAFSLVAIILRIVAMYSSALQPSCTFADNLNGPVDVLSPLLNCPLFATLTILVHFHFVESFGSTNLIKLFSANSSKPNPKVVSITTELPGSDVVSKK